MAPTWADPGLFLQVRPVGFHATTTFQQDLVIKNSNMTIVATVKRGELLFFSHRHFV